MEKRKIISIDSIDIIYVRRIDESDRLWSSIVDLQFRSGEFMLCVFLFLINLNNLTILHKIMSTRSEREFSVLLLHCALKNCLSLRHLNCIGIPFTGEIFCEMCRNNSNLQTLHFDSVEDSALHRLNSFLSGCGSLVDLHMPCLTLIDPIIDKYTEWELPNLPDTLRKLNIGGLLTMNFARSVPSFQHLISYVNRSRGDGNLFLSPVQVGNFINCRALVELAIPYTNITNIDFINIAYRLRNLKRLDISACFNLDARGLRNLNLFT